LEIVLAKGVGISNSYSNGLVNYLVNAFGGIGTINLVNVAKGSTGYVAGKNVGEALANGSIPRFALQLETHAKYQKADIITVFGGVNDSTSSSEVMTSAVSDFVSRLKAYFPNSLIVFFGSNSAPYLFTNSYDIVMENAIAAAVANIENILFIPVQTRKVGRFLTGTGKTTAPTGDGNSDLYVSSDGTHPSNVGHKQTGLFLANELFNNLLNKF
jgi:lysophospholipase L1-like esterase